MSSNFKIPPINVIRVPTFETIYSLDNLNFFPSQISHYYALLSILLLLSSSVLLYAHY
jgi:hypothetical protein